MIFHSRVNATFLTIIQHCGQECVSSLKMREREVIKIRQGDASREDFKTLKSKPTDKTSSKKLHGRQEKLCDMGDSFV